MTETLAFGHHQSRDKAWELGKLVRDYICKEKGFMSVAAEGFEAPGIINTPTVLSHLTLPSPSLNNMYPPITPYLTP